MKLIDSQANYLSGLSWADVEYKGKIYTGWAKRNFGEDEWSEFTGCRYAHMRAEINALKDEYKTKKHDVKICEQFVAKVEQYAKFNAEDPSAKAMFRQLNQKRKELTRLGQEIADREAVVKRAIAAQNSFNEKIRNKIDVKND